MPALRAIAPTRSDLGVHVVGALASGGVYVIECADFGGCVTGHSFRDATSRDWRSARCQGLKEDGG